MIIKRHKDKWRQEMKRRIVYDTKFDIWSFYVAHQVNFNANAFWLDLSWIYLKSCGNVDHRLKRENNPASAVDLSFFLDNILDQIL